MRQLGATVIKRPQKVLWGGHSSKFQDFDGHIWEIAYNRFTPIDMIGKMEFDELHDRAFPIA